MEDRSIKQRMRADAKRRRAAMSPAIRQAYGQAMEKLILASPFYRDAERIFLYLSVKDEPNTWGILHAALMERKYVYVPLCQGRGRMKAVRLREEKDLVPGRMGIPEPGVWSQEALAEELDTVLVPCLAAGRSGERLGHGAGYYDRFLSAGRAVKVCLCFADLVMEDIPMEETDVPMDVLVTEHGAVRCSHV